MECVICGNEEEEEIVKISFFEGSGVCFCEGCLNMLKNTIIEEYKENQEEE